MGVTFLSLWHLHKGPFTPWRRQTAFLVGIHWTPFHSFLLNINCIPGCTGRSKLGRWVLFTGPLERRRGHLSFTFSLRYEIRAAIDLIHWHVRICIMLCSPLPCSAGWIALFPPAGFWKMEPWERKLTPGGITRSTRLSLPPGLGSCFVSRVLSIR